MPPKDPTYEEAMALSTRNSVRLTNQDASVIRRQLDNQQAGHRQQEQGQLQF